MALSAGLVASLVSVEAPPQPATSRDAVADPLAVLILGPTGSGKTALSLALGERFNGEVISCDSVAVYRGMDLGSAKPSPEERRRLPHHLIDVADPNESFTAGEYSRQARTAMHQIAARDHLPIVTGGTGLYLTALTEGLHLVPIRQEQTRAVLTSGHKKNGPGWLHGMLTELDPESARCIHPNDTPKLIRALEILYATGKPLSIVFAVPKESLTGFRLLRIGLNPPRQALYNHLNHRAAQMFEAGLVEETSGLLEQYGRVRALESLGYRQALAVIDGTMTLDEAIAAAQQGHRNYAKRQLTWFRREPEVHWIEDFGGSDGAIERVIEIVRKANP